MAIDSLEALVARLKAEGEPGDPGYLKVGDFHSKNAQAFFGDDKCKAVYSESPKKYKDDIRGVGKVAGLALVYGSSWKLFLDIIPNCTEAQAKAIYGNFFKGLPKYAAWDKKNVKEARDTGYVKSILGRRIHIDTIDSDNWRLVAKGERQAKNLPIQTSGSEIIKYILLKVYTLIDEHNLSRFIGTLLFHEDIYTRIITIPEDKITPEFVEDLNATPKGNSKIVAVDKDGKPTKEFPKSIKMHTSMLEKHNLTIFL